MNNGFLPSYPQVIHNVPVTTGVAIIQHTVKNHLTLPVTTGLNIEKMMNNIPVATGYDITLYLTLDITVYTLVDSHGIHG